MKKVILIIVSALTMLTIPHEMRAQSEPVLKEFGIDAGAFANFPANQNYLTDNIPVLYVTPYFRAGRHEFYAGVVWPLTTQGLYYTDEDINPRMGVLAGYKFYLFDALGIENLFVHYSLQYLRFSGDYTAYYSGTDEPYNTTETDMYINNVIGLGYNIFFDSKERFGLYYTLDYIVSQTGYKLGSPGTIDNSWSTRYVWNNLSTNVGLSFKITSIKKKGKKQE